MRCPNCVLGDLQWVLQGELRFQTDDRGRPCGTAEVCTSEGYSWLKCDTCSAGFEVHGWRDDGAGEVILDVLNSAAEDPELEVESELPPPGAQRMD